MRWVAGFSAAALVVIAVLFATGPNSPVNRIPADTGGKTLLEADLWYTEDQAYQRITAWGDDGQKAYREVLDIDRFIPACYGLLLASLLWLALRRVRVTLSFLDLIVLLPVLAVGFDYLENAALLGLLNGLPSRGTGLAAWAGVLTLLKSGFTLVSLALILAFGALGLWRGRDIPGGRPRGSPTWPTSHPSPTRSGRWKS